MLLLAPLLTLGVGLVAGTGLFLLEFLSSPGLALATLPGQPNGTFQAAVLLLTLYFLPLLGVLLALASGGATCVQHVILRGLPAPVARCRDSPVRQQRLPAHLALDAVLLPVSGSEAEAGGRGLRSGK
jgi:hypothetical protein